MADIRIAGEPYYECEFCWTVVLESSIRKHREYHSGPPLQNPKRVTPTGRVSASAVRRAAKDARIW